MNKMTEAEVLKIVLLKLDTLTFTGDIVWYSRLNSGKINLGSRWIHLCRPGTPDIIAIVDCENGNIKVLFLECKRSGLKRLSYEQKVFFEDMKNKPGVVCALINDPLHLWPIIKEMKGL